MSEITSDMEDGFIDLTFKIKEHIRDTNQEQIFIVIGTYKTQPVGFAFKLAANWEEKYFADTTCYQAQIILTSIGQESDRFVAALNKLYEIRSSPTSMSQRIQATAFTLAGDPMKPEKSHVKMKLFFDENNQAGHYAEHYLNIDLSSGKVYFLEKDESYRESIIQALTTS